MPQQNCTHKGCINFGRYCRRIHSASEGTTLEVKEPVKLKIRTPKNEKQHKEYVKEFLKILAVRPNCEIKIEGVCSKKGEGWHHPDGKHTKDLLMDFKNGFVSCNACNMWLEANHAEAVKLGFIGKRNKQIDRIVLMKRKG